MSEFLWSEATSRAAEQVAQGRLTYTEIAEQVGVTRQTVYNWRRTPEFSERVEAIRQGLQCEAFDRGLALRAERVAAVNDRWDRLRAVIEARAADPKMAGVPGGSTGLLVRTVKAVGGGDEPKLIDLWEVDAATLRELREHEKQAAVELGQWTERRMVEGNVKLYDVTNPPEKL